MTYDVNFAFRISLGVHRRAAFLALVLMSLMVLHHAEGTDMEEAMAEVAARSQGDEDLPSQVETPSGRVVLRLSCSAFQRAAGVRKVNVKRDYT